MDCLAFEPHFLDHLAPIWESFRDQGTLYVNSDLGMVARAARHGLAAEGRSGSTIRTSSAPPRARVEDGPLALVASIGDTKVGRRMGYRRFVFLEHGAGQSYSGTGQHAVESSYSGGPDREDVVLFLVPNAHAAVRWLKTYPNTPVRMVGCPKLDTLPAREPGPGPVVCISFHWPTTQYGLPPEAGNAAGTFRPALPELARRFDLIGHAHPRYALDMRRVYGRIGIPFVEDFDEVCRRADVYVCDNSSTIFEFASTGRPVVLMNAREYRRNVSHGLRFWDAATVGIQVDDPAALGDAIAAALVDSPEQQRAREAALDLVYQPRTNGTAYAVTAINDWLATQDEVAA